MIREVLTHRGFKIVYLPPHTLAAYRNEEYMRQDIASYSITVEAEDYAEPLRQLTETIDSMNDEGEFAEDGVPEYLLKEYPWLRGTPKNIWARLWPFPELPPKLGGALPWAIEQVKEVYALQLSKEEKYARWAEIVMDKYYSGLLTEEEKTEYMQWGFAW